MKILIEVTLIFVITVMASGCVIILTNQMGTTNSIDKRHDLSEAQLSKDYEAELNLKK